MTKIDSDKRFEKETEMENPIPALKIKRVQIDGQKNLSHNIEEEEATSQNITNENLHNNNNDKNPSNLANLKRVSNLDRQKNIGIRPIETEKNLSEKERPIDPAKDVKDAPLEKTPQLRPFRSNRNVLNNDTIVSDNSIGYDTKVLKKYLKKDLKTNQSEIEQKDISEKPWEIDRKNGAKVYELIGYTTIGKVNHALQKEHRQIMLKRILITILLLIIIFLGLIMINPIKSENDFKKILGIDSKYGNQITQEDIANDNDLTESNNLD